MNEPAARSDPATALRRAELQERLDRLNADIPQLMIDYPGEGEFISAFAGQADLISDNAGAADVDWVDDALDAMLTAHGYKSDGDESPPDE